MQKSRFRVSLMLALIFCSPQISAAGTAAPKANVLPELGAAALPSEFSLSITDTIPVSSLASGNFTRFSLGESHTCGITTDGVAHCWGSDNNGRVGDGGAVGGNLVSPVAVDIGDIIGATTFDIISTRHDHTCGLTTDQVVYCWGRDGNGQVGDGGDTSFTVSSPRAVVVSEISGANTFSFVETGWDHTCGITTDGFVYCWGNDGNGRVGDGGTIGDDIVSPVAVDTSGISGAKTFSAISTSHEHTCGITTDDVAYCWGHDGQGQVGDGGTDLFGIASPVAVDVSGIPGAKTFSKIDAGWDHTCGITTDGVAYCWGHDKQGRVGDGGQTGQDILSPVAVDTSGITGAKTFIMISAAHEHTCAITTDEVAYCWGHDANGRVGDGGDMGSNIASPVKVDTSGITGAKTFSSIDTKRNHTCGITTDGVAYCWGHDANGRVGNGGDTGRNIASPVAVDTTTIPGDQTFSEIFAGREHTCGITTDRFAYCWGNDNQGRVGDGGASGANIASPAAVDTSLIPGEPTF